MDGLSKLSFNINEKEMGFTGGRPEMGSKVENKSIVKL